MFQHTCVIMISGITTVRIHNEFLPHCWECIFHLKKINTSRSKLKSPSKLCPIPPQNNKQNTTPMKSYNILTDISMPESQIKFDILLNVISCWKIFIRFRINSTYFHKKIRDVLISVWNSQIVWFLTLIFW